MQDALSWGLVTHYIIICSSLTTWTPVTLWGCWLYQEWLHGSKETRWRAHRSSWCLFSHNNKRLGKEQVGLWDRDFAFRPMDSFWRIGDICRETGFTWKSWRWHLCYKAGHPGENLKLEMAKEGNYNPQLSKEVTNRGGWQKVEGGRYNRDL